MKTRPSRFLAAAGALLLSSAAAAQIAANDYSMAIVTSNNNCLIPGGDKGIYVMKCTNGAARYKINDGRVRTADGLCFDHGVTARDTNASNNARHIKLVKCHNGKSQVWYFMTKGSNMNVAQNAENTNVCMNIEGENDTNGARVLVWPCGFGNPKRSERFYLGGTLNASQRALIAPTTISRLNGGETALFGNGMRLVAAGGGNLVAAGGGNLVAAGGGNLVAAGGGNLVAAGGLNIAAGLIGLDGSTFRNPPAQFMK